MEQFDNSLPIVFDNGSGVTKAGFGGEEVPRTIFQTIIGRPRHASVILGIRKKELYIGEEAQQKRGVLALSYPIKHGIVNDWDAMELIMFETFNVNGFFVATQAILSLYSSGRTSGLIMDSGDGITHVVPISDGYAMTHAIKRIEIAGRDLTEYLIELCHEQGYRFSSSSEREIARDIKEKLCYVSTDYETEIETFNNHNVIDEPYELPDGQIIYLKDQRFRCPEVLFNPSIIGKELPGIHMAIYDSIMKCSLDMRRDLYTNIVLSGGTSMFEGLCERLKSELTYLVPASIKTKIIARTERKYSVWIGGSILSSLTSFDDMWVKQKEYYEIGKTIIHVKSL